jgi:hypothetical protein
VKRTRVLEALGAALVLAGISACGPDYDRTDITGIVSATPAGSINVGRVTVVEGSLIKAHIVSYDTDHKVLPAEITSADSTTLEVAKVVSADDYAFLGLKPGTTTVEIKADGNVVLIIEAVVTRQPTAP